MTSQHPEAAGPAAWVGGHASDHLLASYAAGTIQAVAVWSVEAHLIGCAHCRSAVSTHVDAGRLARNRSVLLASAAIGDGGRGRRLLRRCGLPDYLLDLVAATPSLRWSWLLSAAAVIAVVAGESVAVRYGWTVRGVPPGAPGYPNPEVLTPFLLLAPLLVLAGVAAAFLPSLDPAYRLAVAAPFSGVKLLLVRTVTALTTALVPVVVATFFLPGPGWLPVALLLPSLALCAFALAAATITDARAGAVVAGTLWALPALLLAATHVPLQIVRPGAQLACAAVLCVSAVVLFLRHDRFELGWTR